jgi:hypothetical protein
MSLSDVFGVSVRYIKDHQSLKSRVVASNRKERARGIASREAAT